VPRTNWPQEGARPEDEAKRERVRREDDVAEEAVVRVSGRGMDRAAGQPGVWSDWLGAALRLDVRVLVLGVVLYVVNRPTKPRAEAETGERSPLQDPPAGRAARRQELWREAEEFARQGRFLEAVQHVPGGSWPGCTRRTDPLRADAPNGEYAHAARERRCGQVEQPFHELTGLFEQKWYGQRGGR
jgi:hypothetical protein